MVNVIIDKEICIGCGICAKDCSRKAIEMIDEKAVIDLSNCNGCSHCLAICPVDAVSTPEYEGEILEYDRERFNIEPDVFLNFIKFRRSIRQFKKKDIETEKLNAIIEAGRHSPTGGNRQLNRYIIIKDKIDEIRELALKTLHDLSLDTSVDLDELAHYKKMWIEFYEDYTAKKEDRLFFDAPALVVIVSKDQSDSAEINGAIAASRMELLAYSLGLGSCYIGFFQMALEYNSELKKMLGMKNDEKFILSYVIGYPDVEYKRTVQRKPANVDYI